MRLITSTINVNNNIERLIPSPHTFFSLYIKKDALFSNHFRHVLHPPKSTTEYVESPPDWAPYLLPQESSPPHSPSTVSQAEGEEAAVCERLGAQPLLCTVRRPTAVLSDSFHIAYRPRANFPSNWPRQRARLGFWRAALMTASINFLSLHFLPAKSCLFYHVIVNLDTDWEFLWSYDASCATPLGRFPLSVCCCALYNSFYFCWSIQPLHRFLQEKNIDTPRWTLLVAFFVVLVDVYLRLISNSASIVACVASLVANSFVHMSC